MSFWDGKRVMVTGGGGFLGSYVVEKLNSRGCQHIFVPRSKDFDLRVEDDIKRAFEHIRPNLIIHLAAEVGGIGANRKSPGKFFYDNSIMGIQLIEHARRFDVAKFVCVGTVCSYPKYTPVPFREEDLWNGYPEETNAPYGLAKKMLLVQLQAYRQEYDLNGIYLLPVNMYGPGDNFDPGNSHVVAAIIKKLVDAKRKGRDKVIAWGTGEASREFLYVEDAAEGIILAAERYDEPEPINLGSGREIKIRDLVYLIKDVVDFEGQVEWDTSMPDGQPRRMLDTSRAREKFGFVSKTGFEDGLRKTLNWYQSDQWVAAEGTSIDSMEDLGSEACSK